MAITAWSAKVLRSVICFSENGSDFRATNDDHADRRFFAQQGRGEQGSDAKTL